MSMHDIWINHVIVSFNWCIKNESQALNEQKHRQNPYLHLPLEQILAGYFETRRTYATIAHPNLGEPSFGLYVMGCVKDQPYGALPWEEPLFIALDFGIHFLQCNRLSVTWGKPLPLTGSQFPGESGLRASPSDLIFDYSGDFKRNSRYMGKLMSWPWAFENKAKQSTCS